MKSKLALMLMAAVGSTTLVASAQPPYRTDSAPPPNPPLNLYTVTELPQPPPPPGAGVTFAPSSSNFAPPGMRPVPPDAQYSLFPSFGGRGRGTSAEEANLAREADQLARQLGEAKADSDRDKLKARLGEVLEKQFDQRQRRHENEIEALEAQVKKLKDLVQRRQENRREIVGRRLDQVLRESQGLGW